MADVVAIYWLVADVIATYIHILQQNTMGKAEIFFAAKKNTVKNGGLSKPQTFHP